MKKVFKVILYLLLGIVVLIGGGLAYLYISAYARSGQHLDQLGAEAPVIVIDSQTFRDLNKNGRLDVYEDRREAVERRVDDLLAQMTLEEKVGTMFHQFIGVHPKGELLEAPILTDPFSFGPSNTTLIVAKKMNHFNLFAVPPAAVLATWYNKIQKLAERTRLGIPVTISSDPRHHLTQNANAAMFSGDYSKWPEPLGLAAIGDSALVYQFADIARQEYNAVGIRVALHPMADLATEPRWPRINGTFGEDAALASKLTYAYIKGFQGDSLSASSVSCMTKHFPGGGPQKEGLDPHFQFQKGQVYPGGNFAYHLIPFEAAFAAGTSQIMPYYGVAVDQTSENVGFSFNKEIITGLLREKYGFDGIVCTDWGLISDAKLAGYTILGARAHGVEHLSKEERLIKVINAGVDQFGGEDLVEDLVAIVNAGKIPTARIDKSVRRLLREKFKLGLFDNPYVDADLAVKTVGRSDFMAAGREAQRRSIVLLKNKALSGGYTLPLRGKPKLYVRNVDPGVASRYGEIVDTPEEAEYAIIRISTPYEPMDGLLESLFHHGPLDFQEPMKAEILALTRKVPTIVDIYIDRPAVIPDIAQQAVGLLANFGADDEALLDVVFGNFKPQGRLPVELPSSMEAVKAQLEDMPYDSEEPLFPFGFGLTYKPRSPTTLD